MNDDTNPNPNPSPTPPVAAPEGPLGQFWVAEQNGFDVEKLNAAFTERDTVFAEHQERLKGIPEKPDAYKLDLPETFKAPEGVDVKFDPADPLVGEVLAFAHKSGLPQPVVSELFGLQAKWQVANYQREISAHQEFQKAENTKLGEKADERRAAITNFIKGAQFAEDEVKEANLLLTTEAGVRFLEKFIQQANGTRMPPLNPNNTEPQKPAEQPMADRWYSQRKAS